MESGGGRHEGPLFPPGSASNPPGGARFDKRCRVRKRWEFLAIQRRGRKRQTAHFVVASLPALASSGPRFGFSVSRKVGNSVVRNRLKRRLRELCRRNRERFDSRRDFVLIARPGAERLDARELAREILGDDRG